MESKNTLVIGASENPQRYSYLAVLSLRKHGHGVVALAKRSGKIADVIIQTSFPENESFHTITLYIGPGRQNEYYDLVLNSKPVRVIFNPGTENDEFEKLLRENGIETIEACTLVMLSTGQY